MSEFEIPKTTHGVQVAFEDEGANIGKILGIGILSLIIFVASLALLDDVFSIMRDDEVLKSNLSVPSDLLLNMQNKEIATLGSYELLDSSKSTYRIPIDRAMRLVAEEAFEGETH